MSTGPHGNDGETFMVIPIPPDLASQAPGEEVRIAPAQMSASATLVVEAQLRECFGRVAYSHKTHEKCADIALERLGHIKVAQIVLSAITTGGLLVVLFGPRDGTPVTAGLTAIISTALLALNAYTKENDLGQIAQKHKDAADRLWGVREAYLSLLTDVRAQLLPIADVLAKRDELQQSLSAAYAAAPRTSFKGYRRAQDALQIREDLTFSDEEIDRFLPTPLKRLAVSPVDAK